MLDKLEAKLQGAYTLQNVDELEQMEALFQMEHFTSTDALELGNRIVHEAKKYGGDLIVQIIRTKDQLPVFQYVGDGKSRRNIDFAARKGNAVTATGHCSLWALVKKLTGSDVPAVFGEGSDCLPVGGTFPIFVGGEMTAMVTTSGLHDGMDHLAILGALCAIKNCKVPAFHGTYV